MATVGWRTLKKNVGRAGAFVNPTKDSTEGLRALLRAIVADLNDLHTHTHRYDPTASTSQSSSKAQSTAADTTLGGTLVSWTTYTID